VKRRRPRWSSSGFDHVALSRLVQAFLAKLAVDKRADGFPLCRVEKQLRRKNIPISRSTLNDNALFAGNLLFPRWQCAHDLVRHDPYVADATSFRRQTRSERVFVWTFLSKLCTVYGFSNNVPSSNMPAVQTTPAPALLSALEHTGIIGAAFVGDAPSA